MSIKVCFYRCVKYNHM